MNSFTDGSAFCPGAPKRVPSDSAKHRRVYTSSNVCHSHEWRVDTASGKTLKKRNACLHAVRHAVGKKIACIHGLRSEGVKLHELVHNHLSRITVQTLEKMCKNASEDEQKLRDHNGSFQSQHILLGCTRKFTSNSYFLRMLCCDFTPTILHVLYIQEFQEILYLVIDTILEH